MKLITAKKLNSELKLAVVCSCFNTEITDRLLAGALDQIQKLQIPSDCVTLVRVPGAIEIPLIAQQLARTEDYDAVVALGAVIRGETSHYDTVCQQVSQGCQRVALENNITVVFGVLTTENKAQALQRTGGNHGHKGREAINVAIEMISITSQLKQQQYLSRSFDDIEIIDAVVDA